MWAEGDVMKDRQKPKTKGSEIHSGQAHRREVCLLLDKVENEIDFRKFNSTFPVKFASPFPSCVT